nr:hypothetical protein [Arachidicoccus ginsenosidivorans]
MNPEDIENITVLKTAAATVQYGSAGVEKESMVLL